MTIVCFRCDSSSELGSGHIFRSLSIARYLRGRGYQVVFVCLKLNGSLFDLISQEFEILEIIQSTSDIFSLFSEPSSDQNTAQLKDASLFHSACLASSIYSDITHIFVDHYYLDRSWELSVHDLFPGRYLAAVDDFAHRSHCVDLFINYSCSPRHNFPHVNAKKFCIGPRFTVISNEYLALRPCVIKRQFLSNIFIYIGSVDPDGYSLLLLRALVDLGMPNLTIDLMLGVNFSLEYINKIQGFANQFSFIRVHEPLPSLCFLIAKADLGIGALGTTTWNRAILGLPTISILTAENQQTTAELLGEEDQLSLLSHDCLVDSGQLTSHLKKILKSYSSIPSAFDLCDGWGIHRACLPVCAPQKPYLLREVCQTLSDESLLFNWANDSTVRENSFSTSQIARFDHHQWFVSSFSNLSRKIYILTDQENFPLGQIRYDRLESNSTPSITIDISIDRSVRGLGLAKILLQKSLVAIQKLWSSPHILLAEVKESNQASIKTFLASDFYIAHILDNVVQLEKQLH